MLSHALDITYANSNFLVFTVSCIFCERVLQILFCTKLFNLIKYLRVLFMAFYGDNDVPYSYYLMYVVFCAVMCLALLVVLWIFSNVLLLAVIL